MMRRAVAKGVSVAAAVLLCVGIAASQQSTGDNGAFRSARLADASLNEQREVLRALQGEVKALQGELARVREQLGKVDRQMERLHVAPSSDSPPAGAQASKGASADHDTPSSCTLPYDVTDDGIKRFRPECLARPTCDPPYFVDNGGVKRFHEKCLKPVAAQASDHCSPPYSLLEDGTRRFKLECL